jgi:hypothetical protein
VPGVRVLFVAALSFAAAATAALGNAARAPHAETLYSTTGMIAGLAQNGPLIAWLESGGKRCNSVHIRSLATGLNAAVPSQSARNVTCTWRIAGSPVQLALDSHAATLWTLHERTPLEYDYLVGAGVAPTDRREHRFQELAHTARGAGLWLGRLVGSGDTLAYAVTSVDYEDEAGCLAGNGSCAMRIAAGGSGVYRFVDWQLELVPHTKAAVDVAASNGTLAIVATGAIAEKTGKPVATADLPIDIVDAETGDPVASAQPQGTPLAVALSPHVLATLERTPLGTRVAWYDPETGRPSGSTPVATATSPRLAVNDRYIVFHVGRSIRAITVATGKARTLVRAAATPVGLSLVGSRLAWAENLKRGARIRALQLP